MVIASKEKTPRLAKIVTTSEKITAVRASTEELPVRSTHRHVLALQTSERNKRQILHYY